MKKLFLLFCIVTSTSVFSQDQVAFDILSHISSRASVMQRIGVTAIEINYYRPNANNRKVWGDLVPYDEVWRAGANFSTTIEFSTDVKINGKNLKAGKYSLFVLPTEKEWAFIFDSRSLQFGAFFYQGKSDALRISVPSKKNKTENESLKYTFDDIVYNSGNLTLSWSDKEATISITTDDSTILSKVNERITFAEKNKNAFAYVDLAGWALDHKIMIDKIPEWLKKSREIEGSFGNHFLEARLLAHYKNYKGAIKKAKEVEAKFPMFKNVTDSFISRWEKK
jgi:hypothetical protein